MSLIFAMPAVYDGAAPEERARGGEPRPPGDIVAYLLEVRHLQLVAAIHRLGTITAAASELNLTQPAASHALSKLEGRLGVRMFERGPEGMAITPEGQRVLEASTRILGELDRVEYDVRQLAGGTRGVVRLSTECYTAYRWVPEVVRRLRAEYPGVELRLQPEATYRAAEALRTGELDLALMYAVPDDPAFVTAPVLHDEVVAVVPPEHAWAGRAWVQAADFASETLLVHMNPEDSVLYRVMLKPAGVRPAGVVELRLTEALVEAVRAGLGVAALARWAVAPEVEAGLLAAIPISRGGLHRTWYAVARRERAALPHIARLLHLLTEYAFRTARRDPGAKPARRPRSAAAAKGRRARS